jgi:hypothetical protein
MALTAGRWWVVYELMDGGGNVTRKRFQLNAPADYAAAVVNEAAFRLDLEGVTDCAIKGYHIYQEFYENALSYPTGVELENQALLDFQLYSNPLKTARLAIPGVSADCFVDADGPGYNIVDIEASEVTNFASNFLQGGTALMLMSDGEQAQTLLKGHRRHIASTKG